MPDLTRARFVRPVLIALVAVSLLACSASPGEDGDAPSDSPSDSPPASATPSFSVVRPTPVGSTAVPQAILDAILADASQRTGAPLERLVVTKADLVTWPDGGLGCPEPGMVYIQVLVDGYHVIVADGLTELDYRGSGQGFRICPT
jgi:hypothetical protein